MKKYILKKEVMPDSVCGMGLACTWRTAHVLPLLLMLIAKLFCVCRVHTGEQYIT